MKMLTKQQAKDVLGVGTTVFSEYCNRHIDPIPFAIKMELICDFL